MGRNRQLGDGFSLVALCVREGSGELTYLLGRGPISNFAGPRANQRLKAAQLYHRGGGSQPLHVDVVVETRRRKRGTTVWLCWDVVIVVCCGWPCCAWGGFLQLGATVWLRWCASLFCWAHEWSAVWLTCLACGGGKEFFRLC